MVIFVEGDTDVVFSDRLVKYYRNVSKTAIHSCSIENMRGVSRYASSKFKGKLIADLLPKAERKGRKIYGVCCSYDTDVFEDDEAPKVDWNKVKKTILKLGIEEFCTIEVQSSIEDWLLDDMDGLCAFLKQNDVQKTPKGANGYAKMMSLFKRSGKIYTKGTSIEDFIDQLDMSKIRSKRQLALTELERILNVTILDK